jgi:type VI secretion system protein ImpE
MSNKMSPIDRYQACELNEAVQAASDEVKNAPQDPGKRWLLAELLCFTGDFSRADTHLDLIASQNPKAAPNVAIFRQLLRAEEARQQFFSAGRVPNFLAPPGPELELRLKASIELRGGNNSEAVNLLNQAEQQRPRVAGKCDGAPFEDIRDLDDLCASFFELLTTTGKYYWVPMSSVKILEFRPATRLRDLVWRPARMVVVGGPDGEVYLPALYAGTHTSADPKLRLGRSTSWDGQPVRGTGQREYLIGDRSAAISEITTIEFAEGTR